MGFYGRTSIANSNFVSGYQFDKIYSSRTEMDWAIQGEKDDGVYIGRYVLVEYDQLPLDSFCEFYKKDNDPSGNTPWRVEIIEANDNNEIIKCNLIQGTEKKIEEEDGTTVTKMEYTVVVVIDTTEHPISDKSGYAIINENIDEYLYKSKHDSTVWIKRESGYLSVASLNTITPDFPITVDPPLREGVDSSNSIYYDSDSTSLIKNIHFPTNWKFKLGDVYVNAEGFNHEIPNTQIDGTCNIELIEVADPGIKNINEESEPDTKQLNISLPIIGNTISQVWDIVYGVNRDSPEGDKKQVDSEGKIGDSLQGRLNSFNKIPNGTIPYKRNPSGQIIGISPYGDNWISPSISEQGLTILHLESNPSLQTRDKQDNLVNYDFGFGYIGIDAAGHIVKIKEETNNVILNCGNAFN